MSIEARLWVSSVFGPGDNEVKPYAMAERDAWAVAPSNPGWAWSPAMLSITAPYCELAAATHYVRGCLLPPTLPFLSP
jgi:hypothetical protein